MFDSQCTITLLAARSGARASRRGRGRDARPDASTPGRGSRRPPRGFEFGPSTRESLNSRVPYLSSRTSGQGSRHPPPPPVGMRRGGGGRRGDGGWSGERLFLRAFCARFARVSRPLRTHFARICAHFARLLHAFCAHCGVLGCSGEQPGARPRRFIIHVQSNNI